MSLTYENERKLNNVGLLKYLEDDFEHWKDTARDAYDYTTKGFPSGAIIRVDDVAKALRPVVEAHTDFQNTLATKKLTQKYWIDYFVDLVLDRTWSLITTP